MNILVICHYGLYRDLSFSFVHSQMKALVSAGNRVRVIIPVALGKNVKERSCVVDGVELRYVSFLSFSRLGRNGFNRLSALHSIKGKLTTLLEDFSPDIMYAHTISFDGYIGSALKEILNIPLVIVTHGSDTNLAVKNGRSKDICVICDKADAVIAVSQHLRETLHSTGVTVPIYVIYNGFNSGNVKVPEEKKKNSIIQVSHLNKQKNVEATILIFAEVCKVFEDVSLTIVGDGPERQRLFDMCLELGIKDRVTFTGELENKKSFEKLGESEIFIMPSKCEGFGIVYLEALASGCIVFGTQGEAVSEVITDEKNGFLINPDLIEDSAKKVIEILSDREKMRTISRDAVLLSKNYTWESNAKACASLFSKILQR